MEDSINKSLSHTRRIEKLSTCTKPQQRPDRDYQSTFEFFISSKKNAKSNDLNMLLITSSTRNSSIPDYIDLEPILLKEMFINKIHKGKYLKCQVVEAPFIIDNIMYFLITDSEGFQLEILTLPMYELFYNGSDLTDIMAEGTQMIIKEPFLQIDLPEFLGYNIRVDSPSDILLVEECEQNLNYEQIMEQGNKHFLNKHYSKALKYYSQALNINKNDPRAYLNRAAVNLHLKNYSKSYSDAENSIKYGVKNTEKAYFRMGKASYFMRKFHRSAENFQKCLDINPSNKDADIELKQATERCNESTTGVYDLNSLIENFKKGISDLNVADYEAPEIEVVEVRAGYKAVRAVKPIKKGTLLIVSKAVTIEYDANLDKTKTYVTVDDQNKMQFHKSHSHGLKKLIHKLQGDQELARKVYELDAGDQFDRNNAPNEHIVDIQRLKAIYQLNSFASEEPCSGNQKQSNFNSVQDCVDNSGIWLYPAFVNHSCRPNCFRIYLGDVMLVYNFKDIEANEELTYQYFQNDKSFEDRQRIALQTYGFICNCKQCEFERSDEDIDYRENQIKDHMNTVREAIISTDFERFLSDSEFLKTTINTVLEEVNHLRKIYKLKPEYLNNLSCALCSLSILYKYDDNYTDAGRASEEIFNINKTTGLGISLHAAIDAYQSYNSCSLRQDAVRIYKACYGLFFTTSKPYYEFISQKILEDIKGFQEDLNEFKNLC